MLSPFASLRVNSAKHPCSSLNAADVKATAEILRPDKSGLRMTRPGTLVTYDWFPSSNSKEVRIAYGSKDAG
jgi:hypothetical protein